jgi:ABC-type transport system involved in multi-copper enzyme maturation permease subunit
VAVIAVYGIREAARRRSFLVVLLLTAGFLGLYWLAVDRAFKEVAHGVGDFGVDTEIVAGSILFGLAIFATLFLGAVLVIFLTVGAVRGDAERGLLQPLLVRPLSRFAFLVGRFGGAACVGAAYTIGLYFAALGITSAEGGWRPDQTIAPALEVAAAVVLVCALSILGSTLFSATANGIAVFMLFGAGLVGGLLGQIAEGINSETLANISEKVTWALPFDALYEDALYRITADTHGVTRFVLQLGPFGGAQAAGASMYAWAAVYGALVVVAAALVLRRRDL